MEKAKQFIFEYLHVLIVLGVALLCGIFIIFGGKAEDGSITLDKKPAKIEDSTKQFIEDSRAALNRIMNEDAPTDDETIKEWSKDEAEGKGFYTTIDDILGRILPDGSSPYQCSRYTAWLGTGQSVYSTAHIDYGPVHGKDIAQWLVDNYGFKYIDKPVKGAIGSGGFNTLYGHTAAYLYSTGDHTAMVSDANYVPLQVATHELDITGWVWVVPGNYNPEPEPTPPTPEPTPVPTPKEKGRYVVSGDTMSGIMLEQEGYVEWGESMNRYADSWCSTLVVPGQSIFYGWTHNTGYGLYANDIIKPCDEL